MPNLTAYKRRRQRICTLAECDAVEAALVSAGFRNVIQFARYLTSDGKTVTHGVADYALPEHDEQAIEDVINTALGKTKVSLTGKDDAAKLAAIKAAEYVDAGKGAACKVSDNTKPEEWAKGHETFAAVGLVPKEQGGK